MHEWAFDEYRDTENEVRMGCEELAPGAKPKVAVTLENECSEQKYISVEDDWIVENNLDIGSEWPEEM